MLRSPKTMQRVPTTQALSRHFCSHCPSIVTPAQLGLFALEHPAPSPSANAAAKTSEPRTTNRQDQPCSLASLGGHFSCFGMAMVHRRARGSGRQLARWRLTSAGGALRPPVFPQGQAEEAFAGAWKRRTPGERARPRAVVGPRRAGRALRHSRLRSEEKRYEDRSRSRDRDGTAGSGAGAGDFPRPATTCRNFDAWMVLPVRRGNKPPNPAQNVSDRRENGARVSPRVSAACRQETMASVVSSRARW